jgi:hypothetical protein
LQALRQKNNHLLAQKAGAGKKVAQLPHASRRIACFFLQLAVRAVRKSLISIALWRYCRTIKIRPSRNTGSTTTDPGCSIKSRVAFSPPGSTTSSLRTSNTRLVKASLLLTTLASVLIFGIFFVGTLAPGRNGRSNINVTRRVPRQHAGLV